MQFKLKVKMFRKVAEELRHCHDAMQMNATQTLHGAV